MSLFCVIAFFSIIDSLMCMMCISMEIRIHHICLFFIGGKNSSPCLTTGSVGVFDK